MLGGIPCPTEESAVALSEVGSGGKETARLEGGELGLDLRKLLANPGGVPAELRSHQLGARPKSVLAGVSSRPKVGPPKDDVAKHLGCLPPHRVDHFCPKHRGTAQRPSPGGVLFQAVQYRPQFRAMVPGKGPQDISSQVGSQLSGVAEKLFEGSDPATVDGKAMGEGFRGRLPQLPKHSVDYLARDTPSGGQPDADKRHQTFQGMGLGVIHDARTLPVTEIGRSGAVLTEWHQARIPEGNIAQSELEGRVRLVHFVQKSQELLLSDPEIIGSSLVNGVPDADQSPVPPGSDEEVALSPTQQRVRISSSGRYGKRVFFDERASNKKTGVPGIGSAGIQSETQPGLKEMLRPGAGGVENNLPADRECLAAKRIPDRHSLNAMALLQQADGLGIVCHHRSRFHGRLEEGEYEPGRIVNLAVTKQRRPCEFPSGEMREGSKAFLPRDRAPRRNSAIRIGNAPIAVEGEKIVDQQAASQECFALKSVAISGNHDGEGGNQVRGDSQEGIALSDGLSNTHEIGVLQVTNAPMDHLKRMGGGSTTEISPLHEGDGKPSRCGIPSGTGPEDSAAHDDEVVDLLGQERQISLHCVSSTNVAVYSTA